MGSSQRKLYSYRYVLYKQIKSFSEEQNVSETVKAEDLKKEDQQQTNDGIAFRNYQNKHMNYQLLKQIFQLRMEIL